MEDEKQPPTLSCEVSVISPRERTLRHMKRILAAAATAALPACQQAHGDAPDAPPPYERLLVMQADDFGYDPSGPPPECQDLPEKIRSVPASWEESKKHGNIIVLRVSLPHSLYGHSQLNADAEGGRVLSASETQTDRSDTITIRLLPAKKLPKELSVDIFFACGAGDMKGSGHIPVRIKLTEAPGKGVKLPAKVRK
jgi:hypothetical protein